jgi:cytochrome c
MSPKFRVATLALLGLALLPAADGGFAGSAVAADTTGVSRYKPVTRGGPREARALLDQAAKLVEQKSTAAFTAFNNPKGEFVKNDLYVFVIDKDGIMRAHGGAPDGLVGMQVMDLRDASGKALIREMVDLANAKGEGQVQYVWLNRVSNRVEDKTAFVRKVGDYVVAVGYYMPRASSEQAKVFLDRAVAEVGKAGAEAAFREFNDRKGRFVLDDLYVFAVGLDDAKFYAMGATPGLVGADVRDLRDAAGKPIIQEMIKLARDGGGEYQYVWRNPATNKVENKRSLVRKVDQYMIGVGYYMK